MAEIRPFAAVRYDPARVELEKVLTQPYDKISPDMQQRYLALSPHNFIRVEKGLPQPDDSAQSNVYTRAAATLDGWLGEGVLTREAAPALYVYEQEFEVPGTRHKKTRRGLIALGRLEDYDAGVVHPHERTLSAPKADRLELLRHTRTQTGQLFLLYDDPPRRADSLLAAATRAPATLEARDEYGVLHRVWVASDAALIAQVTAFFADKKLVIADGHHRYETALAYRAECRAKNPAAGPDAPHEFAMFTLVNARSEGLVILPTHRVVSNLAAFDFAAVRQKLAPHFDWYAYPSTAGDEPGAAQAEFRRDLAARSRERRAFGAYAAGVFYLFLLRADASLAALLPDVSPLQRELDVVLLHRFVLQEGLGITPEAVRAEQNLRYERELDAAVAAVDLGAAQVAFLLNPVRAAQVMELALAGEVMPQKSTDFYPKLLSGLVLYRHS
jgi:uncharacterized protein (DUF1015 family)